MTGGVFIPAPMTDEELKREVATLETVDRCKVYARLLKEYRVSVDQIRGIEGLSALPFPHCPACGSADVEGCRLLGHTYPIEAAVSCPTCQDTNRSGTPWCSNPWHRRVSEPK